MQYKKYREGGIYLTNKSQIKHEEARDPKECIIPYAIRSGCLVWSTKEHSSNLPDNHFELPPYILFIFVLLQYVKDQDRFILDISEID